MEPLPEKPLLVAVSLKRKKEALILPAVVATGAAAAETVVAVVIEVVEVAAAVIEVVEVAEVVAAALVMEVVEVAKVGAVGMAIVVAVDKPVAVAIVVSIIERPVCIHVEHNNKHTDQDQRGKQQWEQYESELAVEIHFELDGAQSPAA